MQTNNVTGKIMNLQKIRKKNHWIWSYYDLETLVTNFNCRLKKRQENELIMRHVVPTKQLDHPSAATWSQTSIYIKRTTNKPSHTVKWCSGSRSISWDLVVLGSNHTPPICVVWFFKIFINWWHGQVRWRGSRGSDVWCLAEVALAWQTIVPIGVIQNK
jgi:hypothetical protein